MNTMTQVSEHTTHVSDASFDADVLKATKPVLVDFWAPWCGPCVRMSPILDELAASMKDKVVVAKLNVDDNPKTAKNYGIRGIPTFMIFKNGQVAGSRVTAMSKNDLFKWVESVI
jgi:thioredoxin 1